MLVSLKSLLLIAAIQAVDADPDPQARPGPAGPATAGSVEVGPVVEALGEHQVEVTLRGSPESMARQHAVAVASDLSFMGTLDEMEALAAEGDLVSIPGGPHYAVMDWVFPFGIGEVRTFVERLAYQYRQACGEEMVVTSLTRPFSEQLSNSHQLSVHPAGMAIDLRVPQNPACREFLEDTLLAREEARLLDITRERAPPHYHVALFPGPYADWVETQPELPGVTATAEQAAEQEDTALPSEPGDVGWAWLLVVVVVALALGAGWWSLRRRRATG